MMGKIKYSWNHGIVMHKKSGVEEENVQGDFQVNSCLESGWAVVCLNGIGSDFLCILFLFRFPSLSIVFASQKVFANRFV